MTAVEYLMDKLFDPSTMVEEQLKWFEQAKAMEREQSDEIYQEGYQNGNEAAMNYIDSYKCKCGRPQGGGWKCLRTDCNQNV